MSKTEMIRARVEPKLKAEAEEVLSSLGLSATAAITVFDRQIVLRQGLPFDVLVPNATTRKTFRDTAAGKNVVHAKDADDLFGKLDMFKGD